MNYFLPQQEKVFYPEVVRFPEYWSPQEQKEPPSPEEIQDLVKTEMVTVRL